MLNGDEHFFDDRGVFEQVVELSELRLVWVKPVQQVHAVLRAEDGDAIELRVSFYFLELSRAPLAHAGTKWCEFVPNVFGFPAVPFLDIAGEGR